MLMPAIAVLKAKNGRLLIPEAITLPLMNRRLPFDPLTEALEHADWLV
jgi:hypothetical protein